MIRFFKEAWLVLVVMVGCGLALAAVEKSLEERIAESNKRAVLASISKVIGADPATITIEELTLAGAKVFRAADGAGNTVGWAVPAKADKPDPAYSGVLEIMIGLDAAGQKIIGLEITRSEETPGLGDQVTAESFRGQFRGSADTAGSPFRLVGVAGGEREIATCSGATISSKAVLGAVNRTLAEVQAAIAGR